MDELASRTELAWCRLRLPGLVACLSIALAACAGTPRLTAPPGNGAVPTPVGFPHEIRQVGRDVNGTRSALERWLIDLRTPAEREPVRVLALSGGGAGSAFGAGALVGLSRAGVRPQFDVVTGVSAGALLAPFAFLGPAWDPELEAAFGGGAADGLLRGRGIVSLFRSSIYRGEPLVDLVERFVTDRLLKAVAAEAATGRRLLVATTDLDSQESVIWDLGMIAAHRGPAAKRLFRDVLVASASIPGVFPPVLIRVSTGGASFDEMHVDGGTATPFFLVPEAALFELEPNDRLRRAQVYVLVNGQLSVPKRTTEIRPLKIVSRGFSTTLMHSSRKSLELTATMAERLDMQFTFSSIPDSYPYKGPLDFRNDTMHALFDYGAKCASSGRLWLTVEDALPQGNEPDASGADDGVCPLSRVRQQVAQVEMDAPPVSGARRQR